MIKVLVLDFDGTLVDTRDFIFKVQVDVLKKYGYRVDLDLKKRMGNTQLRKELEHMKVKNIKKITDEINGEFVLHAKFSKVAENISSLKRVPAKMVVLTNNTAKFAKACMKFHKIDFLKVVYGSENVRNKHDGLTKVMKKYRVKKSEILYLGDKVKDIAVASEFGCHGCVITHKASWSSRKELLEAGPEFVIKDLKELPALIAGI